MVGLADVVDPDDVRAVEPAEQSPFGDEPLTDVGALAVVVAQDLDGHGVLEAFIGGAVHGREGTGADHLLQPVAAHPPLHLGHGGASCVRSRSMVAASKARPRATWDLTVFRLRPRTSTISG